jgi:hypothetical protein
VSPSASRLKTAALVLALFAGAADARPAERWPDGEATTVMATITDTSIELPSALPPGLLVFRVTNAGNQAHNFEIGGKDFQTRFARNLRPGDTRALRVYLEPGRYTVYCPIEGHRHPPVALDVRYAERVR